MPNVGVFLNESCYIYKIKCDVFIKITYLYLTDMERGEKAVIKDCM